MKMMAVGVVKSRFSEVLNDVKKGETIGIEYGRKHKPLAKIVPYTQDDHDRRKIGILKNKGTFSFVGDGKITDEEFLNG